MPAQEESGAVFRSEARLVVLHATVSDMNGKLLTSLPQSAFTVYENGVPQHLKFFSREDAPVSLGIVIDSSASMRTRRPAVEAAAIRFVQASNPGDEVFIVNFNSDAYIDCPFTSSVAKLKQGLSHIDSSGTTAMRDAVNMSLEYIRSDAKLEKKILLVVTDGEDNFSLISQEDLIRKVQQSGVLIYAIGLLGDYDRKAAKRSERSLAAITEASGGAAYFPADAGEVDELAPRLAHEIRNQYTLAYTPADASLDGSYRQIKVTVEGSYAPVARTRTGYYASPPVRSTPPSSGPQAR
jgi:VWFA-related protein